MTDPLAQPLRLPCGAVIPNRLCKAAMTEGLGDAQLRATDRHEERQTYLRALSSDPDPARAQRLLEASVEGWLPSDQAIDVPYYLGSKPIGDSQGTKAMEISVQSHPRMVCGRPAAVFLIKKA